MSEKCFCHLNGYAVKDSTARKMCEENSVAVENLGSYIDLKVAEIEYYVDSKIGTAIEGEY